MDALASSFEPAWMVMVLPDTLPDANEEAMAGEPTPIRSSEGKLLLKALEKVTNEVTRLHEDQGKLLREVGLLATAVEGLREMITRKLDSIRPKVESIPALVEEEITGAFKDKELDTLRGKEKVRGKLQFEVYKAVVAVVVAGILGALSTCGYQALMYEARRVSPAAPTH